MYYSLKIPTH